VAIVKLAINLKKPPPLRSGLVSLISTPKCGMKLKTCMSGGDFFVQKNFKSIRVLASLAMLASWKVWKK
jgi:hypothetical protein